ncbi:MAG: 4-hydroxy-tetrahydrodipicolinate reductase [Devosiaceae bacterium]|nr:4-hydroxy-tetrahydrodipicolinate reductase [Devosiaceae bacterium]
MAQMKLCVTGAGGRMGGALIRAIDQTEGLVLHSALERSGANSIGRDAGIGAGLPELNIKITDQTDQALNGADGIIDFTIPAASVILAQKAAKLGLVHIIGTTGCTGEEELEFARAAEMGARIVKSGNMSLGVNLLAVLVKQGAAALGEDFDIEILEMHHNQKIDAPSGTALLLGEAAAKGRKINLEENAVKSRDGIVGKRKTGTIGFATLRGGSVIGEHSVVFAGAGERIELSHVAQDRSLFANGALKAALWANDQPKGFYSMLDVLGFNK